MVLLDLLVLKNENVTWGASAAIPCTRLRSGPACEPNGNAKMATCMGTTFMVDIIEFFAYRKMILSMIYPLKGLRYIFIICLVMMMLKKLQQIEEVAKIEHR